jgi:hypothetical protein
MQKTTDSNDLHETSGGDLKSCHSIYETKDDGENECYAREHEVKLNISKSVTYR